MTNANPFPIEGGCDCKAMRYRMESAPLFVHCCHCRWCQRESGASFALNAMIEADRVVQTAVAGVAAGGCGGRGILRTRTGLAGAKPGAPAEAFARHRGLAGDAEIAGADATMAGRGDRLVHTAVLPNACRVTGCELDSPPSTTIAWPFT